MRDAPPRFPTPGGDRIQRHKKTTGGRSIAAMAERVTRHTPHGGTTGQRGR